MGLHDLKIRIENLISSKGKKGDLRFISGFLRNQDGDEVWKGFVGFWDDLCIESTVKLRSGNCRWRIMEWLCVYRRWVYWLNFVDLWDVAGRDELIPILLKLSMNLVINADAWIDVCLGLDSGWQLQFNWCCCWCWCLAEESRRNCSCRCCCCCLKC